MYEYICNNWLEVLGTLVGLVYIYQEIKASIYLWITGVIMPTDILHCCCRIWVVGMEILQEQVGQYFAHKALAPEEISFLYRDVRCCLYSHSMSFALLYRQRRALPECPRHIPCRRGTDTAHKKVH